ncbi:hypothetical protein EZJ58_5187 [Sodalis ligni]|uniref:Uncharacterized protein n=1 Tax=Sodalis ligni TaxID=2697027 RepID=A0A4R1NR54_9GAMM|nr:hypothetical protein EZJ58_5187 [Sodalis ligni]
MDNNFYFRLVSQWHQFSYEFSCSNYYELKFNTHCAFNALKMHLDEKNNDSHHAKLPNKMELHIKNRNTWLGLSQYVKPIDIYNKFNARDLINIYIDQGSDFELLWRAAINVQIHIEKINGICKFVSKPVLKSV